MHDDTRIADDRLDTWAIERAPKNSFRNETIRAGKVLVRYPFGRDNFTAIDRAGPQT